MRLMQTCCQGRMGRQHQTDGAMNRFSRFKNGNEVKNVLLTFRSAGTRLGRTCWDASLISSCSRRLRGKWSSAGSPKRREGKGNKGEEERQPKSRVTWVFISFGSSNRCCHCWGPELTDPQDAGTWSQQICCVPDRILGSGGSGEVPAARWRDKS